MIFETHPSFTFRKQKKDKEIYCRFLMLKQQVTNTVSLNWIQAAIASGFKLDSYSASNIGFPVRI